MRLELKSIGIVHSPYKTRRDDPPQNGEKISEIEIFYEYKRGLKDVEEFSHLHVLYWLHESKGYTLSVRTPWDSEPHGLFATRTPIGYSVVELIERGRKFVEGEGTGPHIGDACPRIKAYIPKIDSRPNAKVRWLEDKLRL